MRKVVIAETAVSTSLGNDLFSSFQALLKHRSGINEITRFKTFNYRSRYGALINCIENLKKRSLFLNLADMIIDQLKNVPKNSYLFCATTKACIDLLETKDKIRSFDNDTDKYIIPSNICSYVAEKLNLENNGVNISSACASSTIAIILGARMIINKRADSVLVFCGDIVSEFVFSGFSALNALSLEPARPFDIARKGLTLGDGGAAILLMGEDFAKKYGFKYLTSIAGFGIASDANHITAPARDGQGLITAVSKALKLQDIRPDHIGAINTHGTGTIYNDAMEIKAFNHIFTDLEIPGNSIKGAIGHTLGGAGGIEVAMGELMLSEKILPGTIGLSNPDKGALNFIFPNDVEFSKQYLLTTNSGFGGTNAAIILKREDK